MSSHAMVAAAGSSAVAVADSGLRLAPVMTPHGSLRIDRQDDAPPLTAAQAERIQGAFAAGAGHGLIELGASAALAGMPAVFAYWRRFAGRYIAALCARGGAMPAPVPDALDLEREGEACPPMIGAEYVGSAVLAGLWADMERAFHERCTAGGAPVAEVLSALDPAWNLVGRVVLHLAENRRDADAPFAFMATYTSGLSATGQPRHLPLGQALQAYAGSADRAALLALLGPLQRAGEGIPWLRALIDSGGIHHPLRWSAAEAIAFLRDAPALESAGVAVRLPAAWKGGRPARAQASVTVGGRPPSGLGVDAMLDFRSGVAVDGEALTGDEIRALLAGSDGLVFLRGRWVEVDRARLQRSIDRFSAIERRAAEEGIGFQEAMRLLAGADPADASAAVDHDWARIGAGEWLERTLRDLRAPHHVADPGARLRAQLRPYQRVGVGWLRLVSGLGLGACLADDMGLGKTIQVLALLLLLKERGDGPHLLVAPVSLLANWSAEAARFAPDLRVLIAHASAMPAAEVAALDAPRLERVDLVITSYGALRRLPALADHRWSLLILDEAQAIRNPGAQQTRAVKALHGRARIALTGTPVENRLGDLWSIFDFLNPGLLGNARQFAAYVKRLGQDAGAGAPVAPVSPFAPLRDLVRPYILRRMKTDRAVIADLPEKTELTAHCQLARRQAALYQRAVDELAASLAAVDEDPPGIQRRGVVLAFLLRFKQICNHPSQWLGDQAWRGEDSGKFARLAELVEVIAAKQEKALVFTQFREATAPLAAYLGELFGRPGLVLHGGTPPAERQALVRRFQEDESIPFFVLSLKAGGSGLTLTAASHVIHFDRWWNPAVENQATDRAFRIGQQRNVLVHKFVCQGTIEERIDAMIRDKQRLSDDLLGGEDGGGGGAMLTKLDDVALLRLVALDITATAKE